LQSADLAGHEADLLSKISLSIVALDPDNGMLVVRAVPVLHGNYGFGWRSGGTSAPVH